MNGRFRTTGEYFPDDTAKFQVHGTKRKARIRDVPSVGTVVEPAKVRHAWLPFFRRYVKEIAPYDLRRSYAHWLEHAGTTPTRCEIYMGHAPRTSDDRYRWHNVHPYLDEDAKKLEVYLGKAQESMKVAG